MKKIILTRGISASGKSTWAKKEVLQNNAMRFNKDDIRKEEGLFPAGYFYSKDNEEIVMETERARVEDAMRINFHYIIVDNTHLGQGNKHIAYYRSLSEKYGYEFEVKDFYCSREEAIKRDNERNEDERVGEDVIDKQIKIQGNGGYPLNPIFREYFNKDGGIINNLFQCVIVDIDGTLAFMDGKRGPYEFDKVKGDRGNAFLNTLIGQLYNNYYKIFIISGREEICRKETEEWLNDNVCFGYELIMRKEGDNRGDDIIKSEIYEEYIRGKYNVFAVFDDRQRIIDMWRLKYNLPTYQVWYGYF